MGVQPTPSSSGVRVAGDSYQWLAAWQACLLMRRDELRGADNPIDWVGVETEGPGNLDDVVLHRRWPPHTYVQVKYAVDSTTPVDEAYLFAVRTASGTSILRKLVLGWQAARTADGADGSAEVVLSTTRSPAHDDPLISLRDTRTQLLLPRGGVGGPQSKAGRARRRWADAAGVSEEVLLEFLAALRLDTGWDPVQLRELTSLRMRTVGLRDDAGAIDAGVGWVSAQVQAGRRRIEQAEFSTAVDELGLRESTPARRAVSIATLKPDPLASEADVAIDWVERFEGATDFTKRRPAAPATWRELQEDITRIPERLPGPGTAVALTGSQRQATGFMVGAALRDVTGIAEVAIAQRGQLWSSAHPYDAVVTPDLEVRRVGEGADLAVVVAVAAAGPVVQDVLAFLTGSGIPVGDLLICQPPGGARDNAIPDAATALGLAVGIRDATRRAAGRATRVHLFLIGPLGLAVLLGQRWNRIAPTTVYEDVRTPLVYEAAFEVSA